MTSANVNVCRKTVLGNILQCLVETPMLSGEKWKRMLYPSVNGND